LLDTSGSVTDEGTVEMAAAVVGVDRLLFGCDSSFVVLQCARDYLGILMEVAKPAVSIHLHSSADSMIIDCRRASKTEKENTGA